MLYKPVVKDNLHNMQALSVKLCLSCQGEILHSMFYSDEFLSLKMYMGFTVYTSTYEDCLLCLKDK